MAFLTSVAGYVVTALLSAAAGWIAKIIHGWSVDAAQNSAADTEAQQSLQPLKSADPKDGKAIDDASDKALDGL